MADSDVLGILSLLLAAGGAAYLVRARFMNRGAADGEIPSEDPSQQPTTPISSQHMKVLQGTSGDEHNDRIKDTLPPALRDISAKERRSLAEGSATATQPSVPVPVVPPAPPLPAALPAAVVGAVGGGVPPSSRVPSAAKQTLVMPMRTSLAPAATTAEKPKAETPKETPIAKEHQPQRPPPKSGPVPFPEEAPTKRSATNGGPKKPSSPAVTVAIVNAPGAAAAQPAPSSSKTPKVAGAAGPAAVPPPPPSSTKQVVVKGGAVVGGAAAKPASTPAAAPAAAKKKAAAEPLDIPRIEVEEDEDVEPTKVGRLERRAITPAIDKIIIDEGAEKSGAREPSKQLLLIYSMAQTDPGKRRKQNEDSFLVVEDLGLFVVADGMGGHRGGQFASKLAVQTISETYTKKAFEAAPHKDIPIEASELARAIQMSNSAILEEATRRPELKGMGTTICAARFTEDKQRLYVGHVGDSRCYRLRDGVMKQLTTDHTMADYGVAGPEGAHLSRALGVWPTVPIDVVMATPQLGDVYLLCSDGLTKMLPDGTIATQLKHEEDPRAAVERLVFFANAHGGKDNITVILLRVVEPGWKPPKSSRQSRPDT